MSGMRDRHKREEYCIVRELSNQGNKAFYIISLLHIHMHTDATRCNLQQLLPKLCSSIYESKYEPQSLFTLTLLAFVIIKSDEGGESVNPVVAIIAFTVPVLFLVSSSTVVTTFVERAVVSNLSEWMGTR